MNPLQKYIKDSNFKPAFNGIEKSPRRDYLSWFFAAGNENNPLDWIISQDNVDYSGLFNSDIIETVEDFFTRFRIAKNTRTMRYLIHVIDEVVKNFGIDRGETLANHLLNRIIYHYVHEDSNILEFNFRQGTLPYPFFLYVFKDTIDFADEVTEHNVLTRSNILHATHIKISLNKMFGIESGFQYNLHHIYEKEKRVIDQIREGIMDKNSLDINIPLDLRAKDTIITKKLNEDDLTKIGKKGKDIYFGKLKDLEIVHGKYVSGKYEQRNRFNNR